MPARIPHRVLPPLVLLVCVGIAWQLAAATFEVPAVLLPRPLQVCQAFADNLPRLLSATGVTAGAALLGLLLSSLAGVAVAMVFSQSQLIRDSCYPYAIFLQTVPIVAIAPLVVIWMGEGFVAIVTIAFIISLFPIITNATDGLLRIPPGLDELFRLHQATRWQTLWKLQLPHAMPRIVSGVKIASATAVLGAIVGEFFAGVGAQRPGLGYVILMAKGQLRLDLLFAAILICTSLGVAVFYAVSFVSQRLFLYWQAESD